jgi:hypothetical protein
MDSERRGEKGEFLTSGRFLKNRPDAGNSISSCNSSTFWWKRGRDKDMDRIPVKEASYCPDASGILSYTSQHLNQRDTVNGAVR